MFIYASADTQKGKLEYRLPSSTKKPWAFLKNGWQINHISGALLGLNSKFYAAM